MDDNTGTVDDLSNRLENFIDDIVSWIPEFLGVVAIIVISWIIANIADRVIRGALRSVRLDERLSGIQGGRLLSRAIPNFSGFLATVAKWLIVFGGVSLAVTVVGINGLTNLVNAIYGYIPNVITALIIFLVAGAVAGAVVTLARNTLGTTPTGRMVSSIVPIVVMSIATFMILNELQIATEIVTITYAALIGGASLGLALAFGLGGRDVAARMLEGAYQAGRQAREQARRDLERAKPRAERLAERVRRPGR